jgi:hypothetical protein
MGRALASAGVGFLAYVVGVTLAFLLMLLLFQGVGTTGGPPRGGDLTFKIAWSVMAFLIAPGAAAAVAALLSGLLHLRGQWLLGSVAIALFLYGLTLGLSARPISVGNECEVGVAWPVSVPGCD